MEAEALFYLAHTILRLFWSMVTRNLYQLPDQLQYIKANKLTYVEFHIKKIHFVMNRNSILSW